jgi:hypothetical protein
VEPCPYIEKEDMNPIVNTKFNEWTKGKNPVEARIAIFERIRDIPYAVIPELVDPERYVDILRINKGSCTPKHFLLCEMYHRLGLNVLYVTYLFRWDALGLDYPPHLNKLAKAMPARHHLACRVEIEGKLVLVDATVDLPLAKLGIPVNHKWDGVSDTLLPLEPLGEEDIYHSSEAPFMERGFAMESLDFYRELNKWLDQVRGGG